MSFSQVKELPVYGDERGQLIVLEALRQVPFEIKRIYYLVGTGQDVARGFHAHRELFQLAVCVAGSCRMRMNDGERQEDIWLDNARKTILLPPMVWHEMHEFSENCVLLVLASDIYKESDYIRDYSDFKRALSDAKNSSSL